MLLYSDTRHTNFLTIGQKTQALNLLSIKSARVELMKKLTKSMTTQNVSHAKIQESN